MTDSAGPVVLDSGVLLRLAEEAGQALAHEFIETYLGLLPLRTARITGYLAGGETEAVMDTLLSLRVTSSMAGARRLEHYCRELEYQVRSGSCPDPETVFAALSGHGRMIMVEATSVR
jgi:HPt (histidine-containing phosphotransfer) domain-containing protein